MRMNRTVYNIAYLRIKCGKDFFTARIKCGKDFFTAQGT